MFGKEYNFQRIVYEESQKKIFHIASICKRGMGNESIRKHYS